MWNQISKLAAVHGTWAEQSNSKWFRYGSDWWTFMMRSGFVPVNDKNVFEWSGDLVGHEWWRRWLAWTPWVTNNFERVFNDWIVAGQWFQWYISAVPPTQRIVVAHSHGLQPVLIAASGCYIHRLVSVGSPVRHDVADYIVEKYHQPARANIGYWIHVRDKSKDTTGVARPVTLAGGIGDGVLALDRIQALADLNIGIPGIGHSGMLNDPSKFHLWRDLGIIALMEMSDDALQKSRTQSIPFPEWANVYHKTGTTVLRNQRL